MTDEASSGSIAFDRAVDYYDDTRALSGPAAAAVTRALARELRHAQPVLEIGVGTGRIALPLLRAGVRMAGLDLSRPMVARLVEKAGGHVPFPLAIGDAAALPWRDDVFGAGIAVHVLHLIPSWRAALSELARVVRRRGRIVVDIGGWRTGEWGELQRRFLAEAGAHKSSPGAASSAEVDEAMRAFGARPRALAEIIDVATASLGELIDRLEAGLYSFTWGIDEEDRRRAAAATRRWARHALGPLDEEREQRSAIALRAYDL